MDETAEIFCEVSGSALPSGQTTRVPPSPASKTSSIDLKAVDTHDIDVTKEKDDAADTGRSTPAATNQEQSHGKPTKSRPLPGALTRKDRRRTEGTKAKFKPYPRRWIDGVVQGGYDPQQWPVRWKIIVNTIYCIMILSTTYSSSAYAPAASLVQAEFGVSQLVSMLGTSMYVLGFALGPLLFGPASEVVGRKPVYLAAFLALTAVQLGACLAQSMAALVVLRFFGGVFGSSALNNVASSIADMTRVRERMRYNVAYRLVSFGGPTLGPLIGTFVTEEAGWRWNLRILPIFSFAILVVYALVVPETYRPTLEHRRAQLERRQARQKALEEGKTKEDDNDDADSSKKISLSQRYSTALKRPFVFLLTEPVIMIVSLYTAVLYGLLYGTLAAFPYVWQLIRERSPEYASLAYLALLGGFTIGALLIGSWVQDVQFKREYDEMRYTPESRIGPATWVGFLVPIGLILFAWTAPFDKLRGTTDVHYVVPCIAMALFAIGMQTIFNSWLSYAADCYGINSASAMSACTFSRSLLGAAFPLFMRPALEASSVQVLFTIFAGISLVLSFGSYAFVRYGAQLRARSRYATSGV